MVAWFEKLIYKYINAKILHFHDAYENSANQNYIRTLFLIVFIFSTLNNVKYSTRFSSYF
jgi:hypothetical protein